VIIVGSGTVLLLLWALVFRGGGEPQQQAKIDQPADEQAASPVAEGKADWERWEVVPAPATGGAKAKNWYDDIPGTLPESKSGPATGDVKTLELADLAELVGPSVVQVNVTGPEEAGTGSGFVLDKQGTIVTNFHVIEDATAGRIVFSDRTSAPITGYLGVWPEKDIALVRVECPPEKLHPLRLATSAPRQGERVAAFGSPLGLQQSVSEGIVSALRESEELRTLGPIGVNARLIQTTTPISHGNSGGPLVDMKGMVVGVNTWSFRPLGGENVNFAVAAVELPPLLLAKSETPSPLPARDPAADDVRRIALRAAAHGNAGDYDSAIADCTEAIRIDPKYAFAYIMRGQAYLQKGDYDSAIADFTEVIRREPTDADAYYGRGKAYNGKGDYDSAIADFTEVIRLDPTRAWAYFCRSVAYYGKEDYDSAIADSTEVIRLDPDFAFAYIMRANAYSDKRDYDSAIADFTEVIRREPKNAFAYYGRGLAYRGKVLFSQENGLRAAAERDFAQAKRLGYKP
jgi:S1-C subfamily serine protease/lipoprotein NlpI